MDEIYQTKVPTEQSREHILHLVTRLASPRLPLSATLSLQNQTNACIQ